MASSNTNFLNIIMQCDHAEISETFKFNVHIPRLISISSEYFIKTSTGVLY